MRLWTLHPRHLDSRGLVALWREGLLAQAVLGGKTRGYTHHPQLRRFLDSPKPQAMIAAYLHVVQSEASRRGFRFDAGKIGPDAGAAPVSVTDGQMAYEWQHLVAKLRVRDPAWLERVATVTEPEPHPLFLVTPGPIEAWEVVHPSSEGR